MKKDKITITKHGENHMFSIPDSMASVVMDIKGKSCTFYKTGRVRINITDFDIEELHELVLELRNEI